jgi:hypothetical protein
MRNSLWKAGQLGTYSALADSGEPVQVLATALQVLLTTQAPAAALQVAETAPSKPDAQVAAADSRTGAGYCSKPQRDSHASGTNSAATGEDMLM